MPRQRPVNPARNTRSDITAPRDPVEPGSTSDVPIRGEKTNIRFHPTPSVSYEPMYEVLEKRTTILCAGVLLAIIVVGKMFGGALYGLMPLGICILPGIYLWMKELVRKGRKHEWQSEKYRGETVGTILRAVITMTKTKRQLRISSPNQRNG
jgi:hypothetical protein